MRPLLLLLLVLVLAPFAGARDDQTLDDFRRFYKKLESRAERVEAVLALERIESARVVELLEPLLGDGDPEIVHAAVRVLGGLREPASRTALATALQKTKSPVVRAGFLDALTVAGLPLVEDGLSDAVVGALEDKQWTVRLGALRTLAAVGQGDVAPAIAAAAADPEPAVRAGALDGLAVRRSPLVVELALAALADPVWQVRASAIAALGQVRDVRSVPALIARMEVEEGRLVADAAASLEALTGRYFGLDLDAWKGFWKNFGANYKLPTDEDMARQRAARAEAGLRYTTPTATSYHGIDTPSRAVVFVIDVSGSMQTHVVQKERFEAGNYPSFARIDIVKTELARTIERLEPHVRFNVLAFATDVMPWRKELAPATALHKKSALEFVGRLKPLGTAEDAALASAGLGGASNLHKGKTNTHGALMAALGVDPGRGATTATDYRVDVDTIFFLSDGQPTHGDFIEERDIQRVFREANALRRVVLHTLAIGDFSTGFMETLASESGGTFVNLGR
ncbi:MAG: VWA domain-containing protein [Planctomycetaceae bacterium]|nr:VWA domain-containing protein [Planctomycetaceae bacterium]